MKYIYVCGPTVYSDVHIGNMRPIMTFDIFNRSLKELGDKLTFIHNITDIDDKIIVRAEQENFLEKEISSKYETLYLQLLEDANIVKPDCLPRVTDNIAGIVNYIKQLINKGNAYEVMGNVYFDIKSVTNYGSVSHRDINTMNFEGKKDKKHPGDFALWKKTNKGITFDSPWGKGRPGWHTECSYFVSKFAGGHLDIHGGGIDLIFPHHENENAQNRAIHNRDITKHWNHVGHINLEEEKMSKSLGNVILAKDFFKENGPDVLRYIFLTASYSAPINLSKTLINQAKTQVKRLNKIFIKSQLKEAKLINVKDEATLISKWKFAAFNKVFNETLKSFNKDENKEDASKIFSLLKLIGFKFTEKEISKEDKKLYKEWILAREIKDFEKADQLRNILHCKKIL